MDQYGLSYRLSFFLFAVYLYALFGSPTPDDPGIAEVLIGALLIFSAGTSVLNVVSHRHVWMLPLSLLFLYGMSAMLIIGLFNNNDVGTILRDIAAFLFFLVPLLFYDLFARQEKALKYLAVALVFVGVCFSLRALLPVYGFYEAPDELLYLANSPLVLLTALLLLSAVFSDIYNRSITIRTLLVCVICVIPFMAMLIDVQRAPMSAVFLTIGIALCVMIYFRPAQGGVLLLAVAGGAFILFPVIEDITHEILSKTSRVGLNMRTEELRAVLSAIGETPITALFGLGWGASFSAPSVGGLHVPYTHSLLSYFLLKGGLVGLSMIAAFCMVVGREVSRIWSIRPVFGLAVFWPFIIPVFLYASHKSLDFGLVILFIFVCARIMKQNDRHADGQDMFAPEVLPKGAA